MLCHNAVVTGLVFGVAGVRPNHSGQLCRATVGSASHQRGDGGCQSVAFLAVVRHTDRHQQCAEVGITNSQLAEVAGGLANGWGWEVGERNRDVHRGDDQLGCLHKLVAVERTVWVQELKQVERCEVARRVV